MRTHALLSAVTVTAALTLTACSEQADADDQAAVTDAPVQTVADTTADDQAATDAPILVAEPEGSLATGEMAIGDADAPLTVIEYASLTCPGCASFHANHFQTIKSDLIETGLVRFIYRELPTGPVNLSYAGSILARCAATEKGAPAYFAINDALFTRQRDWVYGANPGEALESIFSQVGMDRAAMQACLSRPELKAAVDANAERARDAGVQGTPTLIVNGEPFDVRRDVDAVVAELKALAEAAQ